MSERGPLFVVGNGLSLKDANLDLLVGRESWAMNRIHLIYPYTAWRPTRWLHADIDLTGYTIDSIAHDTLLHHVAVGYPCYVDDQIIKMLDDTYPGRKPSQNLRVMNACEQHTAMDISSPNRPAAWHVDDADLPDDADEALLCLLGSGSVCKFGSGIFVWIECGIAMGYDPIVLVGTDLYQPRQFPAFDLNHFDRTYFPDVGDPYFLSRQTPTLKYGHCLCRKYADAKGITIYNTSPSELLDDIYLRAKLEELV